MKFGKRLLDQAVPEWAASYLAYKNLKGHIKRVQLAQKCQLMMPNLPEEARELVHSENPPLGSVSQERGQFERELLGEVDKINNFYLFKENEFKILFARQFESEVQSLLARPLSQPVDVAELRPFFEFCQRLDDLRNFTVLNSMAVLKICKKYDKKTESSFKATFQPVLVRQPFYTSTVLATLLTEVQCLCAQLVWLTSKVAPAAADFSCPICRNILSDPVVLSCTHKFCRPCVLAVAEADSKPCCPVCMKSFDALDPANFRVDSILAQFVQSYFGGAVKQSIPPMVGGLRDDFGFGRSLNNIEHGLAMRGGGQKGSNLLSRHETPMSSPHIMYSTAVGKAFGGDSPRPRRDLILTTIAIVLLFLFLAHFRGPPVTAAFPPLGALGEGIEEGGALPAPQLPSFPNTVFVGHRKNDADSICASIAAAHLFNGYAARSDDPNRETLYLLNRFGLGAPPLSTDRTFDGKSWCILDHIQKDKVPEGVALDRLVCVIDHHQLMGNVIEIDEPRMIDLQPWGSTCTMLAFKYFQSRTPIPVGIAGCLLGGLLSDTVNLRGPTTTDHDRQAAEHLARIANIVDYEELAKEMFLAKSATDDLGPEALVMTDYKLFTFGEQQIGIGVAETLTPASILARKDEIIEVLREEKARSGLAMIFFVTVDVVNLNSVAMGASEAEERALLAGMGAKMTEPHLFDIGPLVSRKKDILPLLAKYIKEANAI